MENIQTDIQIDNKFTDIHKYKLNDTYTDRQIDNLQIDKLA